MTKFYCKICSYKTARKSSYDKHCESKRHKNNKRFYDGLVKDADKDNIENSDEFSISPNASSMHTLGSSLKCNFCGLEYIHRKNLLRHHKSCKKMKMSTKIDVIKDELKNKENVIHDLKIKYKSKNNECKIKDIQLRQNLSQIKMYESIINCSSSIVKDSFLTINTIAKKYANAPALETCNINDYGLPKDDEFYDNLLYDWKNGLIGQTLGNLIINKHKKDNKELQSIWTTDSARNTFFIKSKNGKSDEESFWSIDKNGVETTGNLIEPIISHLKIVFQNKNDKLAQEVDATLFDECTTKMILILKFIKALNDNIVSRKVLRYIGPQLHINAIN